MTEYILGFDPGGQNNFGWCLAENSDSLPLTIINSGCVSNASEAFKAIEKYFRRGTVVGAGIDAPLYWRTDGARKSDQLVRDLIPPIDLGSKNPKSSVLSVNSLQGACLAQGVMIASLLRCEVPKLKITEAHPKAYLKVIDKEKALFIQDPEWGKDKGSHLRDAALACVAAWHMLHPANCINLFAEEQQDAKKQNGEIFSLIPGPDVEYWFPEKRQPDKPTLLVMSIPDDKSHAVTGIH